MAVASEAPVLSASALAQDVQIFEYSKAANPIESGSTPRIPIKSFLPDLYATGGTRAVLLDLSAELGTAYPATGPGLLAQFLRIRAGEQLATACNASSEFYFVIRGRGRSETADGSISWKSGDFLALPGLEATHYADEDTAFYAVNDSPLFAYLGARQSHPRFRPTLYTREAVMHELQAAQNDPQASTRSRVSVLLANKNFEQTMTITHTLWTMFGTIAPGTRQLPHRHQSVASISSSMRKQASTLLSVPTSTKTGRSRIRSVWIGSRGLLL